VKRRGKRRLNTAQTGDKKDAVNINRQGQKNTIRATVSKDGNIIRERKKIDKKPTKEERGKEKNLRYSVHRGDPLCLLSQGKGRKRYTNTRANWWEEYLVWGSAASGNKNGHTEEKKNMWGGIV